MIAREIISSNSRVTPWIAVCWCLLSCAACRETVGFLSVDLVLPGTVPPLVCEGDPRQISTVEMIVTHQDGTESSAFDIKDPPPSLADIPLGEVTVEVLTKNRSGASNRRGKATTTITAGSNAPITIILLEDICTSPLCDGDFDNLATTFEEALGTDPNNADTDGDGLEDGLEVRECCSDPLSDTDQTCQNLIQRVVPNAGEVGTSVMIKAATTQPSVPASLGGAPLEGPLVDGQQIYGFVGPDAAVGEVTLSSQGQTSIYRDLFAVLSSAPVRIVDLDREAGATKDLLATVIDMVHFDNRLHILGQSQTIPGQPPVTVLLIIDRQNQTSRRIKVPSQGIPVALAIGDRWGIVVIRNEQNLTQVVLFDGIHSPATQPRILPLPLMHPVSIHLEPDTGVVYILGQSDILRLDLNAPGKSAAISLRALFGQNDAPPEQRRQEGCVGMAYLPRKAPSTAGHTDALYIACNLPAENCTEQTCRASGVILQLSPLTKCFPLTGEIPGADLAGSCWARHTASSLDQVRGAPVIDGPMLKVYQQVTSGLVAIDASIQPASTQPLESWVQLRWRSDQPSFRTMALNQTGQLFVADGTLIWRLLPRQAAPLSRLGSSFNPAQGGEIQQLSLSTDNTVLDLGTLDQSMIQYLTSVCLNRGKDCLCDQI